MTGLETKGIGKYYCMAQQIRPTLTKEEWALIEANRKDEEMYSEFKGNLPLIEAFEACLNPANEKGNRSFNQGKFEALLGSIMACKIATVNGRPYQDNKSPK